VRTALLLLITAATLGLVGCKKDKEAPAGDCKGVVSGALDRVMRGGMRSGGAPAGAEMEKIAKDLAATLAPINDAMVRACTDDAWSADALACISAAQNGKEFDACEAKLTPAQKQHADKLVDDAKAKSAPVASPECARYADYEIKCGKGKESDRPTIVQFCAKARGGATEVTYQLIALESTCATTATDCDSYHQCIEQKKKDTTPK
jgi:hypothetical protein